MIVPRAAVCMLFGALLSTGAVRGQRVPEWSLREELRLGSVDDSATAFAGIGAVRGGPGGRIYIVEPLSSSSQIRIFDATGAAVGSFGRSGRGPGEFQAISELGFLGDTVYVIDLGLRRISYFTAPGDFIRSDEVRSTPMAPRPRVPTALFQDGSGTVFVRTTREQTTQWLRVDRAGVVLDTLRGYDRLLPAQATALGPIISSPQRPGEPLHAQSADGRFLYIVEPPVADDRRQGAFGITRISAAGDTIWSRQYTYVPEPVPSSEYDEFLAFAERRGVSAARARMMRPYTPYRFPVVTAVAASDGSLWLRRESAPDATPIRWEVFDPQGSRIAEIRIPASVRVHAVEGNRLYAVTSDDLGVPYVVRYEVVR